MSSTNSPTDTRCGACVVLGWSCSPYCVFSKCFPRDRPNKFAIIQRAYGTALVWNWLARMVPDHRMQATEYLLREATHHLRWQAKYRPGGRHGTVVSPCFGGGERAVNIGAAFDSVRVTVPLLPFGKDFCPGESSGVKGIRD